MFYYDSTYLLVILGAIISGLAALNVKRTFAKYSKVASASGLTARSAAERILRGAGITDVRIERVSGSLTDHYSPGEKVLRLSDSVYDSASVAAIGVAAHECGHAVQHRQGYFPLKLRSASVPVAKIGSMLSWPVIIAGLLLGMLDLARVGVFLFSFVLLFQLITLPVEFNASSRAKQILAADGILSADELAGVDRVLGAAAMTYVASLFSTILQMARLILLTRGDRRR